MGGLLDTANATKIETVDEEVVAEKVTKVVDATPSQKGETFLGTANPIGLGLGGLGFILMWFLNNYFLEDLTGPIPFGLVVVGIMGASFYLVWDSIDRQKTVTLAVGYLMLTAVPYLAGLEYGSSPGVSEISVSEESNELSFVVRGTFTSATAEILLDEVSLWSETLDLSNDRVKFSVPLSTIFMGNSQDYLLNMENTYSIHVTSTSSGSSSVDIIPKLLNREVENSAAKIEMRTETETSGTETETTVTGVSVESLVGMFDSSVSAHDGGTHNMSDLSQQRLPISSDYTIQLKIIKDGSQTYQSELITVNGLDATWISSATGGASGSTNGWLAIPGTATDTLGNEYLARDDFFTGDDCYNFQIVVTNQFFSTMNDASPGTGVVISDNAWELNFDSEESNSEVNTCTP